MPYQYTILNNAKELDQETGYYYYGARYYDPQVSTWLSVDPLAEKYPAFSPYNFTMNNPVRLVDADGKEGEDWIYNKKTHQYVWDSNVTKKSETPEGFEYIGASVNDVSLHFNDHHPILKYLNTPKVIYNDWPGELKEHKLNDFEKIREMGMFGEFLYDSANGIYTTGQFFMFRSVGASEVVNLDGTITSSDQAVNGFVSTALIGAEWANGIKAASGGLKIAKTSTSGWLSFNKNVKIPKSFNSSFHKTALKARLYRLNIARTNRLFSKQIFRAHDFLNATQTGSSLLKLYNN